MLMQELDRMIQEEPYLSAMATVDKRKYIVSKWNASHGEPIDEDAVALFLCDESRGALTEEQRTFAKERRAEFEHCNQIAVYRLLQCGDVVDIRLHRRGALDLAQQRNRRHLVSGPAEYCRIFLPQCTVPCGRRIPLCGGL